jgi:hypothetical protein
MEDKGGHEIGHDAQHGDKERKESAACQPAALVAALAVSASVSVLL